MAQRAIRFSETTDKGIQDATRKCGFSTPTAFIRHAVEQELSGRSEELVGAEERLAASILESVSLRESCMRNVAGHISFGQSARWDL
jgi:hypothetical protein